MNLEQRFDELLVHGILHLFGYDHEISDRDALTMEEKSQELLKMIRKTESGYFTVIKHIGIQ